MATLSQEECPSLAIVGQLLLRLDALDGRARAEIEDALFSPLRACRRTIVADVLGNGNGERAALDGIARLAGVDENATFSALVCGHGAAIDCTMPL